MFSFGSRSTGLGHEANGRDVADATGTTHDASSVNSVAEMIELPRFCLTFQEWLPIGRRGLASTPHVSSPRLRKSPPANVQELFVTQDEIYPQKGQHTLLHAHTRTHARLTLSHTDTDRQGGRLTDRHTHTHTQKNTRKPTHIVSANFCCTNQIKQKSAKKEPT